ncbi:BnaC06g01180D [Brassica napus]|uniref:BnaC06g01180D protein n=2 Tax=Brassica napus TaxID=3708 RepID=A0A078G8B7_BRANA|nr:BnaC06g01180D [Brassica napus]
MVTRDKLISWGLAVPATCVLCVGHNENRQHLFFNCDFSKQVWSFFTSRLQLVPPILFEDGLRWLKNPAREKNVKLIVRLLHQACLYLIWKERNSRVHTAVARPPEAIIAEIKQIIRLRLDPLARAQTLAHGEDSVLAVWFSIF